MNDVDAIVNLLRGVSTVARKWISLSQPFYNGMPHGTSHEPPTFEQMKRNVQWADGPGQTSTTVIRMAAHVGTHVDAARHFFPAGRSIDEYPPEQFAGPGVVLDVRRDGVVPITADELRSISPRIEPRDIVFLYFGYAERFGDDAYRHHPYLSVDAAEFLVERQVKIVGTDTITPDFPVAHRTTGFDHPIHRYLLGHGVLIIEHLGPGLSDVAGHRMTLLAFPLRIVGGDGSPSPVMALVEE